MRELRFDPAWPESWKLSYRFDQLEVYGRRHDLGYSYAYRNRLKHALDLVRRAAPPGSSVLDVAGGQGNLAIRLAELGYAVTWNDIRADLKGYVELKHEHGVLSFRPGNIFEVEFAEQFDVVLLSEVIEHVAHPDALLSRGAALARDRGHVVVTTPNGGYLRNRLPRFSACPDPSVFEAGQFKPDAAGHIFLLHEDELCLLAAQAGLAVIEISLFTNPLTHGYFHTGPLLRALPERLVWQLERLTPRLPRQLSRKAHVHMAALLAKP